MDKAKEVENLQNRVVELERQLAEAQAAALELSSSEKDSAQAGTAQKRRQQKPEDNYENLIDSEERFKKAIFLAPYPVMIRRDDGKVIMVNAVWTEITGYTLRDIPTIEEWTRKAYGTLGPQRQSFIGNEGFAQESIKQWGEFEIATRSGEKRVWDFSTAPLGFDEKGREVVMVMAVDMTDRNLVEQNLRTARDEAIWLARFPGENPNPVARVSGEGIVLYCNPPAAKLPGWPCVVNEFLPMPLRPFVHQALTQGRVVEQELTLGTKIYSVSVIPVLNESYVNLYGRDITEQKEAEKALRKSEERFAKAFHASPNAIIISQLSDGLILEVNEGWKEIFGHDPEEVLGRTILELGIYANPDDRKRALERLREHGSLRDPRDRCAP